MCKPFDSTRVNEFPPRQKWAKLRNMHHGRPWDKGYTEELVGHLQQLWGFDVVLESVMNGLAKSSIAHSGLSKEAY